MESLRNDYSSGLLDAASPPCVTIYQRTHRHHPGNQQDPIRYRNLVRTVESSLARRYPQAAVSSLLEPFHALADDSHFWVHMSDGLAVLGARGFFRTYHLRRSVRDIAVAADTFHVKPLLRILQSADRYQILGLSRHAIRLFEGDRDELQEIGPAPGVPVTLAEALGEELTEPHMTVAAYGGTGPGHSFAYQGHGGKSQEVEIDTERFFRAVDRAVIEHHSRPSGLPLILATLPEHRTLFRGVSHNPFLVDRGVDVHPDALSIDDLRKRAWQAIEPSYRERLEALTDAFESARARGLGADALADIAMAVVMGRVATLLVDADRETPGRIDAATGRITLADLADPQVDDAIDDLASMAIARGARVVVVPAERMPTDTGAAAIYRF